jgi:hypothetical protein
LELGIGHLHSFPELNLGRIRQDAVGGYLDLKLDVELGLKVTLPRFPDKELCIQEQVA